MGESLRSAGAKLLAIGMAVSITITVIVAVVILLASSAQYARSYVIGAAVGILALVVSQVIVMLVSKLSELVILVVALCAYGAGLAGAVAALSWLSHRPGVIMLWTGLGVIIGACCYLVAVAVTYSRLRILIFNPPSSNDTPKSSSH